MMPRPDPRSPMASIKAMMRNASKSNDECEGGV